MKRLAIVMAVLLLLLMGCTQGTAANTIKDGKSLSDVIANVDSKFMEKYGYPTISNFATPLDQKHLTDFYGLAPEDITEMAGNYSMMILSNETMIVVKAAEGKAEKIVTAMQERRQALENQYESYRVGGSYERALAGEVYQKGDYVFLILVGQPSGTGENITYDYAGDMAMTKAAIDEMFN